MKRLITAMLLPRSGRRLPVWSQMDDVFALRLATDLKDAFDKLMNRNY